jgi:hypothetical protein
MRRFALALAIFCAAAASAELPETCNANRFASWTGEFPSVRVKESGTWIAGARAEGHICVTDGTTFRWAAATSIELGAVPSTKRSQWTGNWTRKPSGDGDVEGNFLILAKDDFLVVKGEAGWRAKFKDSLIHHGDISSAAPLAGNVLQLSDAECVARIVWINGRLLVSDNRKCGGMNVVFDGIYTH